MNFLQTTATRSPGRWHIESKEEQQMRSRFSKKEKEQILEIAKQYMVAVDFRGHLEELHNDSDDFIEVPVWGLEAALLAAYELGKKSK